MFPYLNRVSAVQPMQRMRAAFTCRSPVTPVAIRFSISLSLTNIGRLLPLICAAREFTAATCYRWVAFHHRVA